FDVERPNREARPDLDYRYGNLGSARLLPAFGLDQCRRERRRIDRHSKPRPQIQQRSEMVLVRVGQHDAKQVAPLTLEEGNIGQDRIDAGKFGTRKSDTEIDGQPLACAGRTKAIEAKVHPDLADAAERQKNEIWRARQDQVPLRPKKTSPALIVSR